MREDLGPVIAVTSHPGSHPGATKTVAPYGQPVVKVVSGGRG
jgi:hypothetical protein